MVEIMSVVNVDDEQRLPRSQCGRAALDIESSGASPNGLAARTCLLKKAWVRGALVTVAMPRFRPQ
jgi:hypothetical protein